jgi:peptidoglycan/LPS O-acetylase OafA/YrhL
MLLARTFKPRKIKYAFWICSAILLATFAVPYIASECSLSMNSLYEVVCIAFVFPIIVWLGACGSTEGSTGKISGLLGDLSYPLYIVHYPVMYLFYAWLIDKHFYSFEDTLLMPAIVVAVSIALAYACLKLYDEPVRKWLARKFMNRK